MAIVDTVRKVVPDRVRTAVGVWSLNMASRSWPVLKMYLMALRGRVPDSMGLDKRYCLYDYDGRRIIAPRNASGVFWEIFEDGVYDVLWGFEAGDVVLDIGAYVGMFTVKAALAYDKGCRVIAVEPNPSHYALLEYNCRGLDVTLVPKALMAKEGVRKLYAGRAAGADSLIIRHGGCIDVEVTTLDQLVSDLGLDHIDFIKLDAEGAELHVLNGGRKTLERGCRLAISVYHTTEEGRASLSGVIGLLEDWGYTVVVRQGLRSYVYAKKD